VFHPYVAVGRDYFGDSVRGPENTELEAVLDRAYPERFAHPLEPPGGEFASTYIFSFLEACVRRCAREGQFDSHTDAVTEAIDELLRVLDSRAYEVVCCRHVSHVTTTSGDEVRIGDVTVVPEHDGRRELLLRVQDEIRGAARAWNREEPF